MSKFGNAVWVMISQVYAACEAIMSLLAGNLCLTITVLLAESSLIHRSQDIRQVSSDSAGHVCQTQTVMLGETG